MGKQNYAEPDYDVDFATGEDEWHWENRKEAFLENLLSSGREGGYIYNKNDPGGETNFGITKRSYPNVDIKALDREGAKAIYRRDFTKKGEKFFGHTPEAIKFMDMEVNIGYTPKMKKIVQRALNSLLPEGEKVDVDGKFGKEIGEAIKSVQSNFSSKIIINALTKYQQKYYRGLDDYKYFGKSWEKRAIYDPIKTD